MNMNAMEEHTRKEAESKEQRRIEREALNRNAPKAYGGNLEGLITQMLTGWDSSSTGEIVQGLADELHAIWTIIASRGGGDTHITDEALGHLVWRLEMKMSATASLLDRIEQANETERAVDAPASRPKLREHVTQHLEDVGAELERMAYAMDSVLAQFVAEPTEGAKADHAKFEAAYLNAKRSLRYAGSEFDREVSK